MGILALIAEFENDIRRERQLDGIAKSKERGVPLRGSTQAHREGGREFATFGALRLSPLSIGPMALCISSWTGRLVALDNSRKIHKIVSRSREHQECRTTDRIKITGACLRTPEAAQPPYSAAHERARVAKVGVVRQRWNSAPAMFSRLNRVASIA
jgi:hypothetical protein